MALGGTSKRTKIFLSVFAILIIATVLFREKIINPNTLSELGKAKETAIDFLKPNDNNPSSTPGPLYEQNKETAPANPQNQNKVDSSTGTTKTAPQNQQKIGTQEQTLTVNGILNWTNNARKDNGAESLSLSAKLNSAANGKLNDMFQNQYFEHTSPSGEGPSYWIEKSGYQYIILGENLALGNFENDKKLVDAWMASSGHRANILNERYTEIGIAVGQGTWNGRTTWIAVQEFAMPLASCTKPDETIKTQIIAYEQRVKELKEIITNSNGYVVPPDNNTVNNTDIKSNSSNNGTTSTDESASKDAIKEYNNLIKEINTLMEEYNRQVATYNKCIS